MDRICLCPRGAGAEKTYVGRETGRGREAPKMERGGCRSEGGICACRPCREELHLPVAQLRMTLRMR